MDRRMFVAGAFCTVIGLGEHAAAEPAVNLKIEHDDLVATCGGRPLLRYRRRIEPAPSGMNPLLGASGYIHPLYAPDGAVVTDEFCPDHPHQRGVFSAWTRAEVDYRGQKLPVDFWNIHDGKGRTLSSAGVRILPPENGAPGFRSNQVFEAQVNGVWTPMLDELWDVRFPEQRAANPDAANAAYVIDFTVKQTPRVAMTLPKYHYGGFAIRGARSWGKGSDVIVLTSEGKDRAMADTSRPRWIDMSGTVDGRKAGVTLMEHSKSFGAPNGVRMHAEMPYTVYALPQSGPITFEAGKEVVFRYRLVAHNGAANVDLLNQLWTEMPK